MRLVAIVRPLASSSESSRNSAKLEHVIGEDAGLLPLREGRGAELLADRAEDARVVVDVQLQLAGDLFGDLEVALADGRLRAFLRSRPIETKP